MANVDARYGLKPEKYLNGAPYNGQCRKYHIAADYNTALYIGDVVDLNGTSTQTGADFDVAGFYPDIEKPTLTDGNYMIGPIVAFEPTWDNLDRAYSPASTEGYAYVADDPNIIFSAQMDSATTLTAADIGLNGYLVGTHSGSGYTFLSGMEADESTFDDADSSNMFMLMGIVHRPDNELGQHVDALLLPSLHRYRTDTTGILGV